jgi:hypothetical protein
MLVAVIGIAGLVYSSYTLTSNSVTQISTIQKEIDTAMARLTELEKTITADTTTADATRSNSKELELLRIRVENLARELENKGGHNPPLGRRSP